MQITAFPLAKINYMCLRCVQKGCLALRVLTKVIINFCRTIVSVKVVRALYQLAKNFMIHNDYLAVVFLQLTLWVDFCL